MKTFTVVETYDLGPTMTRWLRAANAWCEAHNCQIWPAPPPRLRTYPKLISREVGP